MFFCEICSSIGIFLHSANLICRNTAISKCFRGSLRLRDSESRLYMTAPRLAVPILSLEVSASCTISRKDVRLICSQTCNDLTGHKTVLGVVPLVARLVMRYSVALLVPRSDRVVGERPI